MRRAGRLVALALGIASVADVARADPITRAGFRERMATAITQVVGQPTVVVDEHTLKTKAADGTEFTVNIDNAYSAYIADQGALDAIVQRYAEVLTQRSGAETLDQLVVIVRPTDYVVRSLPSGASLDKFVPPKPMAGDLSYFLAVDSPTATRSASKADLARWRISEAEAWRRATMNIKERVGALNQVRLGDADGPSGFGAESGLAPSILADPSLCGPASPNGLSGQVVLVAGRDFFLYAVPTDAGMTKAFWDAVREGVASGQSMSATPITCREGKWVEVQEPR